MTEEFEESGWRCIPHVDLDATEDKWLMLDSTGPDARPLAPPPKHVIENFHELPDTVQEFLRERCGIAIDDPPPAQQNLQSKLF